MASATVRVVARITAQPGKADEVEALLRGLVEPTRAEEGCVSYQLCQSIDDPAEFVCIEEWASASAIDAHMTTSHVRAAFAKAPPLLGKPPEIRRYSIIL